VPKPTLIFQLGHRHHRRSGERWKFVQQVRDDKDGDIARDVAQKFGLIFAGGMLGIRYGLLPWKRFELLDAISKCYFGARALLPDDSVLLRRGIKALHEKVRELPSLSAFRASSSGVARLGELDGYRNGSKCLIKREVFNSIFVSTHQRQLVMRWQLRQKRITTAVAKSADHRTELGPKEQFDWADGKRRRSYELHARQSTH